MKLELSGKPISGNHKHGRRKDGSTFVVAEAVREIARVRSIALIAATEQRWEIPDYCTVDLDIYNVRMDRDNVMKPLNDALQGVLFHHDSRILDGRTRRFKDLHGPRLVLVIQPVDGLAYGFHRPSVRRVSPSEPARRRSPRKTRATVVPEVIQALLDRHDVRDRPLPNGNENSR